MRPAIDIDGLRIIWHMFYIDKRNIPMALIEIPETGMVKSTYADWITFDVEKQKDHGLEEKG